MGKVLGLCCRICFAPVPSICHRQSGSLFLCICPFRNKQRVLAPAGNPKPDSTSLRWLRSLKRAVSKLCSYRLGLFPHWHTIYMGPVRQMLSKSFSSFVPALGGLAALAAASSEALSIQVCSRASTCPVVPAAHCTPLVEWSQGIIVLPFRTNWFISAWLPVSWPRSDEYMIYMGVCSAHKNYTPSAYLHTCGISCDISFIWAEI